MGHTKYWGALWFASLLAFRVFPPLLPPSALLCRLLALCRRLLLPLLLSGEWMEVGDFSFPSHLLVAAATSFCFLTFFHHFFYVGLSPFLFTFYLLSLFFCWAKAHFPILFFGINNSDNNYYYYNNNNNNVYQKNNNNKR